MVVQAPGTAGNAFQLSNIVRAQYASGKIAVPLSDGLYVSLRHVKGVPSVDSHGFSLSKLQMMDLIVDRLVQLRGHGVGEVLADPDQDVDSRIYQLAEQLRSTLSSVSTPSGSFAAGIIEPGLLFDLVA